MAEHPATQEAPPGDVARPKRVASTVLDMVRSLGVLVVVVALTLIFVPGLLHPSKSQRFAAVSYSDEVDGFHELTKLDALVPSGLGPSWYANSADLSHPDPARTQLHIGWVTPSNDYLALEESNEPARAFVASVIGKRGLTVVRHEQIAGQTWAMSLSGRGEHSLARTTAAGITVVITGSGSTAQLEQLAGSLRPS